MYANKQQQHSNPSSSSNPFMARTTPPLKHAGDKGTDEMSGLRESMGRMNVVDHSGDFSVPDKPSSRETKSRDVSRGRNKLTHPSLTALFLRGLAQSTARQAPSLTTSTRTPLPMLHLRTAVLRQ